MYEGMEAEIHIVPQKQTVRKEEKKREETDMINVHIDRLTDRKKERLR
jgi:hypothetical protein